MNPTDPGLLSALEAACPGRVQARASDRLRMAHDASHYLLTPRAVVVPRDSEQVGALLRVSATQGVPLTFRSGGTSLSGQAGTDGVLVDTRRHFRHVEVLDDGLRVRVQPGITLRQVNNRLVPHGRMLGPDPASESACTVGGVVANNSSGMTCGTELNAYNTIDSLVLVLASGTVVDTGAVDADERLLALEPDLFAGLSRLRDRVRGDAESVRRITAQYAIKNTMGYGLNSFLDHSSPAQILAHLAVGSEGTLAFVAEATFHTVPLRRLAATGLLVFPSLQLAMDAMPDLVGAGPTAVELLDAASLRVAQAGGHLPDVTVASQAALLVEWQADGADELAERTRTAQRVIDVVLAGSASALRTDAASRAALWHVRKGLYAAVAGARPPGSTTLLEDIAVPVPALARTCADLEALFDKHAYSGSVIFGHAKDGNLHFMLTERFSAGVPATRYAEFTEEMVDVVLGHGGTLKAEHGTGRVMAPYVRRQFGDELYDVMRQVKLLLDPGGVLNPGVLLTDDSDTHLRHLKSVPVVETEVDRCVDCGYCEPVCPSRDLTTTPRQRIALRRELAAAEASGDSVLVRELERDSVYDVVETCAVDGMCATACPVLIDTGELVKRLRTQGNSRITASAWESAARHWSGVTRAAGLGLTVAANVPAPAPEAVTRAARSVLGAERVPQWTPDLPRGGVTRRHVPAGAPDAVYLPSCLNTMFRAADGGPGVMSAVLALAERAGISLHVPEAIAGACCGTPWSSKGLPGGYETMAERVRRTVAAGDADTPIVTDASSCTEGFARQLAPRQVLDAVTFVASTILPRLTVSGRLGSLSLHPTCSSTRTGANAALLTVAEAIAEDVVVADDWACCGFAGDRGLLHPELTASATAPEAASVRRQTFDAYASVNRACEIGMTRATGSTYQHLLELVERATRPTAQRRSGATHGRIS